MRCINGECLGVEAVRAETLHVDYSRYFTFAVWRIFAGSMVACVIVHAIAVVDDVLEAHIVFV